MPKQDQSQPGFFRSVGRFLSAARTVTANVLFVLVIVVILLLLLGGEERIEVPDGSALVLHLDAPIMEEVPRPDPLELLLAGGRDARRPIELRDLLRVLEHAGRDDRIGALVLDLDRFPGAAPATLRTVGAAIERFQATGKPVAVVADGLGQSQYYLASYADHLYLNPMGQVLLTGLALQPTFFASAIDKLKVNVNVIRAGEYKSAVEPFLRDDMSDEARADAQRLIDDLWEGIRDTMAANRGMQPETLDVLIETQAERLRTTQGDLARLALETGLVDELLSRDAGRNRLGQLVGFDEERETFRQIGHRDYLRQVPAAGLRDRSPDVAVIVAEGAIMGGEQARGTGVGEATVRLIRQARNDDAIRAIVLRINSPGGTPFASELIRRELELAQVSGKPVVISMGALAASGGYWASVTSDRIYADADTITGSIGVYALLPTFEESFAALGIYSDGVATHSISGAGNPLQPLNPVLREIIEQRVAEANRQFVEIVARGRDMPITEVEAIAAGRIWSGRAAQEVGLVDELGDLDAAVTAAAELAGLERWTSDYVEDPPTSRELILERLLGGSVGRILSSQLSSSRFDRVRRMGLLADEQLVMLEQLLDSDGLQAICARCEVSVR